ncbi:MAG: UDP-N-acetylglucosamine 1-carboxyvinyltransferase [Clostridiales bacterium]|jgi:UDP-N-acetylglucosamine 1-carboxyvinyltransferase|nr:UDP-N-acetylglucosamine 1-carboxyvinyltransferase [Clostridiales bacterium]
MQLLINGGKAPQGTIDIKAAKNSVLPILACCTMIPHDVTIDNVAPLGDVLQMIEILKSLGCSVAWHDDSITINSSRLNDYRVSAQYANKLRASISLLGPLMARCGAADVALPGGCNIGARPVDIHIKGMHKLGATITQGQQLECRVSSLRPDKIVLPFPSVGATQNIMMLACGIEGVTTIQGAAQEPEVQDLGDFVNAMGGNIKGAGTSTIEIEGRTNWQGGHYTPIGDRIVGSTYIFTSALGLGGDVTVQGINCMHIQTTLKILQDMGCTISIGKSWARVKSNGRLKSFGYIKTRPHPGFATDMQPQLSVVLALSKGKSILVEDIFENRFGHVTQLNSMGSDIQIKGNSIHIQGVSSLQPSETLQALDLRCGAALVLAGLATEGRSKISNTQYIDRGYWMLERDLNSIGCDVQWIG